MAKQIQSVVLGIAVSTILYGLWWSTSLVSERGVIITKRWMTTLKYDLPIEVVETSTELPQGYTKLISTQDSSFMRLNSDGDPEVYQQPTFTYQIIRLKSQRPLVIEGQQNQHVTYASLPPDGVNPERLSEYILDIKTGRGQREFKLPYYEWQCYEPFQEINVQFTKFGTIWSIGSL